MAPISRCENEVDRNEKGLRVEAFLKDIRTFYCRVPEEQPQPVLLVVPERTEVVFR